MNFFASLIGLDAASPLFRNNYLREDYKKLDRSDAKFVDVIHTDCSPVSQSIFKIFVVSILLLNI